MVDSSASLSSSRVVGGLSRRSLMGMATLGLLVSGCAENKAESPTADEASSGPPTLSPDVAVATEALRRIRAAREAVSGTLARFPVGRARLGPLVQLHLVHEDALVEAVPDRVENPVPKAAPYVVPPQREIALQKLASRERQLHDSLGALALRAQSGDFARLLASMGAGLGQQLARWPS